MPVQIMQKCAIRWVAVGWKQAFFQLEATLEPHPVRVVVDISAQLREPFTAKYRADGSNCATWFGWLQREVQSNDSDSKNSVSGTDISLPLVGYNGEYILLKPIH